VDEVNDRILVSEFENQRIQIFSHDGNYLGQFGKGGSGDGEFHFPYGIALDPDTQNILVADKKNHRVQIFDKNGLYLNAFGGHGINVGQFQQPTAIVFNSHSEILVSELDGFRVQIY